MKTYGFDYREGEDELFVYVSQSQGYQLLKDLAENLACDGSEFQLWIKNVKRIEVVKED